MRKILDYLSGLEQNNNRDWYHAHKEEQRAAVAKFEELIAGLMLELRRTDATLPLMEPRELTFKLVRDTRFSHDKSPYNPSFRAHIAAGGKLPVPVGCFLFLRPGDRSFLGGGLFADMFANATAMVRDHIAANGEAWGEILASPAFAERFTVGGTALKKVPRGYDPGHPQAEFLKYKSWFLEYPVSDKTLLEPGFLPRAVEVFEAMRPFNDFLNQALAGFEMPAR